MVDIFGIHWAAADRALLLPFFVLCIVIIIKNYVRIKRAASGLVSPMHQKLLFQNFSIKKYLAKAVLLSSALLGIFIALLQPQWGKIDQVVIQEGRDLLIVLDISRSMKAKDIKPNRLDFAKLKIRNLLSHIPAQRVGLIVFSGSAFVQCPLTADYAAFLMFLENVDTETISSGTTALDRGLTKALEVFNESEGRKNKLVLLLTDGEDFSMHLDVIQKKALQEQINLFALGIGTPEGAPIPKVGMTGKNLGHETDAQGNIVLSKLNEDLLTKLCNQLHGFYVKATYDDGDIASIAKRVQAYDKERFTDKKLSLYQDQYPWFLAFAWMCLLLEWLL